jgi:hypothetical protein
MVNRVASIRRYYLDVSSSLLLLLLLPVHPL